MVEVTQADRETTRDVINALHLRAPCTDIIARHRLASTAALTAERDALAKERDQWKEAARQAIPSLAAAISLLERGGKAAKKAAPSNTMFDMMLDDYRKSLDAARKALHDPT